MTRTLQVRQATAADMQAIISLIDQASRWLRLKGTDQWARPWPSQEGRDHRVRRGLRLGKTWIVDDEDGVVGTVTCDRRANPMLWDESERAEPAVYMSRLIVNRGAAGQEIGASLVDWAAARASQEWGARWIRIDVWTTNQDLHKYYQARGFSFRRFCRDADYPSGALFQKSTSSLTPQDRFRLSNADMAPVPGQTGSLRFLAKPASRAAM